ncbi:MAG: tetratricopeptide repeat protein [Spirochaetaceae bacterium]|nr:MAG: tetratricopeptide repeat protein [Spirochaetaceae bacterium]
MTWVDLPPASRTELKREYQLRRDVYEKALHEVQRRLRGSLLHVGLEPTIKYRVKDFDSYYDKVLRRMKHNGLKQKRLQLTDLLGIRVVCPFMSDLKEIEEHIQRAFRVVEVERKGAHFSSREFGYESTHLLIELPDDIGESFHLDEDLVVEIQLRTNLQDAWAEVEHELIYKSEFTPFDEPLQRKLAALNANLTLADIVFQEIRDYQRQLHSELSKRRREFWQRIQEAGRGGPRIATPDRSQAGFAPDDELGIPDVIDPSLVGAVNESIDNMLLKALYAHNQQQFKKAISIYSRILEQKPRAHIQAIVHIHRGMAYFAESDYNRAVADFGRTLELDDDNWKAYYYRGVVKRIMGQQREALQDFNSGLAVDGFQFDTLFARAQLYFEQGDYQRAIDDCTAALNVFPDSPEVTDLQQRAADALEQQRS